MVNSIKMNPVLSTKKIYSTSSELIPESSQPMKNDTFLTIEHILGSAPSFKPKKSDSRNNEKKNENNFECIGNVVALEYLKRNCCSKNFSPSELLESTVDYFKVKQIDDNLIDTINLSKKFSWLRSVKLSNDNYSNNVLFELNSNSRNLIHIRLVRDILPNEELKGWFSEELIMLLGLPFLAPINIRGNNCYTCHHCHKSFEYPNPLKMHLATLCEQHSIDILWFKLHYNLIKTHQTQQLSGFELFSPYYQLAIPQISFNPTNNLAPPFLTSPHNFLIHNEQQSAFRSITPPSRSQQQSSTQDLKKEILAQPSSLASSLSQSVQLEENSIHHSLPSAAFHYNLSHSLMPTSTSMNSSNNEAAMSTAAQIETIVSNMGASKQGHLCIYCGKLYSRKYGLKIHIRTHTGFKPLKCKYCLRPFGDPSNLNKHIRLHLQTGNLTYRCHLCHKTLARRRDLQRHIETKHCLNSNQSNEESTI